MGRLDRESLRDIAFREFITEFRGRISEIRSLKVSYSIPLELQNSLDKYISDYIENPDLFQTRINFSKLRKLSQCSDIFLKNVEKEKSS